MGSGHILVYAFEVFLQLYEAEGESTRNAVEIILEKNLFGLDIDKRALQLAYFALLMKGRQYNRRFLTKKLQSNVYPVPDNFGISESELQLVHFNFPNQEKGYADLALILEMFKTSPDLGSLISFKGIDFENLSAGILKQNVFFFDEELKQIIQVAELLQMKYTIAITNPPYMGASGMNKELATFVKKHYPASKSDLFAVFMERIKDLIEPLGYYAMITQHAWMFLSSFEKLRLKINQQTIVNMAHLGTRAFEEIGGEVVQTTAFVISPIKHSNYTGSYLRLVDFPNHEEKERKAYEAIQTEKSEHLYFTLQDNFIKIPGAPISYWVSENVFELFQVESKIIENITAKAGIVTGADHIYTKIWSEVTKTHIKFVNNHAEDIKNGKFFPFAKGGEYRRWYGNNEYVINLHDLWYNSDINKAVRRGDLDAYFKLSISWGYVTSGRPSFRIYSDCAFATAAPELISKSSNDTMFLLAFLNTKVAEYFCALINPTLNLPSGYVMKLPIKQADNPVLIRKKSEENIAFSKNDWDSLETSWDYKKHPLI